MKKIAFFVEGATEQIFLRVLLREYFSQKNIHITAVSEDGGVVTVIFEDQEHGEELYKALIYSCNNDERVKSCLLDNLPNLHAEGYRFFMALHDLQPLYVESDIPDLEDTSFFDSPDDATVEIILAQKSFEAWMLAEYTHMIRLVPSATIDAINEIMGCDVQAFEIDSYHQPAHKLDQIYRIGFAKGYRKKQPFLERIFYTFDFVHLLVGCSARSRQLGRFHNFLGSI